MMELKMCSSYSRESSRPCRLSEMAKTRKHSSERVILRQKSFYPANRTGISSKGMSRVKRSSKAKLFIIQLTNIKLKCQPEPTLETPCES